MYTMTYDLELESDRTMTFKLPDYIPLGFHKILLVVDEKPASVADDKFEAAWQRSLARMKRGYHLGGQMPTRESLFII